MPGSTHISCENWLKTYNNFLYHKSIFFKGRLLTLETNLTKNLSLIVFLTMKARRKKYKKTLLSWQNSGETDEWLNKNFIL